MNHTVVGALSFSASAPHLEVRDALSVGASRSGSSCSTGSSTTAGSSFCRASGSATWLPISWEDLFGYVPWLVKSYIDPTHNSGDRYRAAGFVRLGQSKGFSRMRKGPKHYARHRKVKDVYLNTLVPDFRLQAGLLPRPKAPKPPQETCPFLPLSGSSFPSPTMWIPPFSRTASSSKSRTSRRSPGRSRASARTSLPRSGKRKHAAILIFTPWDFCPVWAERASNPLPSP